MLDEILLKVFESREQSARNENITFIIKKTVPVPVKGDNTLLERMISNIIDNAIRYTPPEGCVEIALEKNDKFALLNIRDTGIGIPEESLPFIFDRFYVVDKSRCKKSNYPVDCGFSRTYSTLNITLISLCQFPCFC